MTDIVPDRHPGRRPRPSIMKRVRPDADGPGLPSNGDRRDQAGTDPAFPWLEDAVSGQDPGADRAAGRLPVVQRGDRGGGGNHGGHGPDLAWPLRGAGAGRIDRSGPVRPAGAVYPGAGRAGEGAGLPVTGPCGGAVVAVVVSGTGPGGGDPGHRGGVVGLDGVAVAGPGGDQTVAVPLLVVSA